MTSPSNENIDLSSFEEGLIQDWVSKATETPTIRTASSPNDSSAYAMSCVDPFTNPGSIQPGYQITDIDSTDASAITTGVTGMDLGIYNGTAAAYGNGVTKLYKILSTNNFSDLVNNTPSTPTWPHSIPNSQSGFICDCIVTWLNIGGTKGYYLLYSYNLSTTPGAGRLGRFDIGVNSDWGAGNSSDTAYSLTTGTIADANNSLYCDRPMVKGTNGKIYIGSGYQVDMLDTFVTSPTLQTNVIDIPSDFRIKSLGWHKGYLVIVAQRSISAATMKGEVAVFFWDTLDPDTFQEEYYVTNASIAGACKVSGDGDLYLWTMENTSFGHMHRFNGQQFEEVYELDSIPSHGMVDTFKDGFVWGYGNTIYKYASVRLGSSRKSLWKTNSLNGALVNTTGISCVKRLSPNNDIIHVSGTHDSGSYIRKTDTSKYADDASYALNSFSFPHRSTINKFKTYFPALATGCSVLLKYLYNYGNSYTNYGTISYAATTLMSPANPQNGDGDVTRKVWDYKINEIDEFRLEIIWSGTSNAANQVKLKRLIIESEKPSTKDNY